MRRRHRSRPNFWSSLDTELKIILVFVLFGIWHTGGIDIYISEFKRWLGAITFTSSEGKTLGGLAIFGAPMIWIMLVVGGWYYSIVTYFTIKYIWKRFF